MRGWLYPFALACLVYGGMYFYYNLADEPEAAAEWVDDGQEVELSEGEP